MPTDMSFGVNHVSRNLFWGSRLPEGLLAQPRNLARPAFWRMFADLTRFNRAAREVLTNTSWEERSLADFADSLQLSRTFLDLYLLPMTAAIWSTPHDRMLEFPAAALLRFLYNHGLLGVTTHHPWRTVVGGSRQYREKLIAPFSDHIHVACGATAIEQRDGGVRIIDERGKITIFDAAIVATHADEALDLLANPTETESQLLSAFNYSSNAVRLHRDSRVMPPRRSAWMSWNYRVEGDLSSGYQASIHYWMNRLQQLPGSEDFFVSLNAPRDLIDEELVAWEGTYHHPVFTLDSIRAQHQLVTLNRNGPIYFAGSYFRNGFHEDALMSGQEAANAILAQIDESASVVSL